MAIPPILQVEGGRIQGAPNAFDNSIEVFKGIPYAAPPISANRFKPPRPIVPWDDVRVCDTIGPVCPQAPPDPKYINVLAGHPQSEDCLYLNIWKPNNTHKKPYPVFVWYHGGGFREGGSADPNFDGTGLAQKGIIVVVPSFRLSIFGYFAHPELSADSASGTSGMAGMLDALEVLKWIRKNISNFNGDTNRVTIAGQSAGNAMCHTLLVSPLSKGLVHGVILQSGARSLQEPSTANGPMSYRSLKQAEDEGIEILKELGLKNIEEFQKFDNMDKLLELSLRRDKRCWGPPPFFRLIQDGYVIPKPWNEILKDGPANDVPVIAGMNKDEGGTYNEPRFTYNDFLDCVEGRFGSDSTYGKGGKEWVEKFFSLYPSKDKETGKGPLQAWNAASRDNTRNNISLWAQEYHQKTKSPVYGYFFTHPIPPWHNWKPDYNIPKTPGFTNQKGPVAGAFHGAEYPYTFNSLITNDSRPWSELDYIVGDKTSQLWANFTKYGNPNGPDGRNELPQGVARWPNLVEQPDKLLEIGGHWQTIETVDPERKNFWTSYIHSQKAW